MRRSSGTASVRLAICLAGIGVAAVGCSRRALSVFFDLPAPQEGEIQPAPVTPSGAPDQVSGVFVAVDTTRPPIESVIDPDSVRELLPRDHAGNIDWMAAVKDGVIRPRAGLPGAAPDLPGRFEFDFDFVFPGPDTTQDAVFAHSSHTEWVGCQQCHSRIFRYRNTPITMGDVFAGRYCAECHGKVAFPVMTCERCHPRLAMPAGRMEPALLGDLALARVNRDSSRVSMEGFPRAKFSHWIHRIRYRCKACHVELFEPKAGANSVTMAMLREGQSCGRCHNGQTAFAPSFANCMRCHVSDPEAEPS